MHNGLMTWIEMEWPIAFDELLERKRFSLFIGMPFENGMDEVPGISPTRNHMPFLVKTVKEAWVGVIEMNKDYKLVNVYKDKIEGIK